LSLLLFHQLKRISHEGETEVKDLSDCEKLEVLLDKQSRERALKTKIVQDHQSTAVLNL